MIRLVVGLGNPGQQYEKTRHNVGFLFLDRLCADAGSIWSNESRFNGLLANASILGKKVYFLKPLTFMNKSGLSVGAVARYYKIAAEEILVVHDELDFSAGKTRLKFGGGHAGHNGLRDIVANIGTKDFYRLRVGVGRPAAGKNVANYVLSGFSKSDVGLVDNAFNDIERHFNEIVTGDISKVMNVLNSSV